MKPSSEYRASLVALEKRVSAAKHSWGEEDVRESDVIPVWTASRQLDRLVKPKERWVKG